MEAEVFPELCIDDSSFLKTITEREPCSVCGKSRKYYCYTCCLPIGSVESRTPDVKLPLLIDVIKHPQEVNGKSTAIQAATLAPRHVTVYTYPAIPNYNSETVVLVFPGDKAMTLEAFARAHCRESRAESAKSRSTKSLDSPSQSTGSHSTENCRKRTTPEDDETAASAQCIDYKRTKNELEVDIEDREIIESNTAVNTDTGNSKTITSDNTNETSNADLTDENTEKEPSDNSIKDQHSHESSDKTDASGSIEKRKTKKYTNSGIERVVFIDSTWHQVHKIASDERLKALPRFELESRKTRFWRHQQGKPETYLATVEAIYYFCRDFHELFIAEPYVGQYDNLLFYFKFMYNRIRDMYDGQRVIRAYNKDMQPKGNQKGNQKGKGKGKGEDDEAGLKEEKVDDKSDETE